jgi:hypothetical protein
MHYWEQQEQELLRKENAWLDELSPFMKLVDNNITFGVLFLTINLLGFGIGLAIGVML